MKNLQTSLLSVLLLAVLGSCQSSGNGGYVPASFGYAFGGTAILMVISLVVAAFITKKGEGKH